MKNGLRMLLFVAVAGGATACKTSVNTVERAEPTSQRQMISDRRILTDPSLNRKVWIVGLNEALTDTGLLKVQVEVFNRTRSIQRFSYRFEWFDANGMLVRSPSIGAVPCQIEGGESLFLSSLAPRADSTDFRIKFIEGKR
jgi:uncharacterized protein YcfL